MAEGELLNMYDILQTTKDTFGMEDELTSLHLAIGVMQGEL